MIKPFYDNVLLKIEKEKDVIDAGDGLVIKKAVGQKTQFKGTVVACGEGRISLYGNIIPLKVNEGDTVLFNKYAGTEIEFNDEMFLMIKETDILASIKE